MEIPNFARVSRLRFISERLRVYRQIFARESGKVLQANRTRYREADRQGEKKRKVEKGT